MTGKTISKVLKIAKNSLVVKSTSDSIINHFEFNFSTVNLSKIETRHV